MALPLKGLLERLKRFTLPDEEVRTVTRQELARLGVEIPFEKITVRDGVLYINTDGNRVLKSEIFLRQEKIFSVLKEKFGARAPQRLG